MLLSPGQNLTGTKPSEDATQAEICSPNKGRYLVFEAIFHMLGRRGDYGFGTQASKAAAENQFRTNLKQLVLFISSTILYEQRGAAEFSRGPLRVADHLQVTLVCRYIHGDINVVMQ